ncbi:unnamed protein product, partial [Closterium sp. NIES-54]
MIALCQEHRLEHRTKHIAHRYFLARELQQRGQLRLVYVATRANTLVALELEELELEALALESLELEVLELEPASPLPAPSPYPEQTGGLTERREPASRPASPVRIGRRVPRPRPPPVPGTHAMAFRPSSVPLRVPLPAPPESSLSAVRDP